MKNDKPHECEIDRWENEGGSCGYSEAEVAKTFDSTTVHWDGDRRRIVILALPLGQPDANVIHLR